MDQPLQTEQNSQTTSIVGTFIFNDKGEVLLLQRQTDNLDGGQWGTPGGKIEAGETEFEAALRKVKEQTGLTVPDLQVLGVHLIRTPHGNVRMTSYLGSVKSEVVVVLNQAKHHAWQWFKMDALLNNTTILHGIPFILRDFGLLTFEGRDPTLPDGSSAELLL